LKQPADLLALEHLGHSSVEITSGTYGHLEQATRQRESRRWPGFSASERYNGLYKPASETDSQTEATESPKHEGASAMKARVPGPHDSLRNWLVEHLVDTARWREDKAQEYPDDVRNGNSAMAIAEAADLLAAYEEKDLPDGFRAIARLGELVNPVAWWDAFPWSPGAGRAASRFGFERDPGDVTDDAVAQLLVDIYRGMLEDEAELFSDYSASERAEPNRQELLELLRREGFSPVPARADLDDRIVQLLVELRDLLNERLPV
jgi:hypothetical protein